MLDERTLPARYAPAGRAARVLVIVPAAMLFRFVQGLVVKGITAGAVNG
ncbi:hypothetical protein [Deinococcus metallilatus]|uniref:ABC-type maltose transport system permease subunit n=1 Tax=Deinococcus metallilatus TaxID=1211322 RepID=A0ABR6MWD0_9DEIO|nr:hypothetical protein [Deinococcus metallilatus]MBB5295690.1 ABC-type maltose transport system permease subunit [Deinococcus metallilatus]GMA14221.1 hypothetical protein GCM10025871_05520 [Deinococcus metallilatus]